MARPCTVCPRSNIGAINDARFVEKQSIAAITARFGIQKSTLQRHFSTCTKAPAAPVLVDALATVAPPTAPPVGAPRCLVCPSPDRAAIEDGLAHNVSREALERKHGISVKGI